VNLRHDSAEVRRARISPALFQSYLPRPARFLRDAFLPADALPRA
jgi:hypothetical protein